MSARLPRVLLLCDRLDIAGGVERFVCQVANHLSTQGFDVAVGSTQTTRAQVAYELAGAVRVLSAARPLPVGDGWQAVLARQWHIGRGLADLVEREAPDVIILNGLTTACSVLAVGRLRQLVKIQHWARDWGRAWPFAKNVICCDHNHFFARSRVWRLARGWLYRDTAAAVSLTTADAQRFRALGVSTEVIYNASSLRVASPSCARELLVLAVGRLVSQKGFDLLLAAWPRVLNAVPGAVLRIVGDGPLREALQDQAAQAGVAHSVHWVPHTADMAAEYRAAAVFVLPSRYEGMPLALLEAQAMGVASVAFDCPTGPAEILDAHTGILVKPGDTDGLADALVALLDDAELRARMAYAALQRSAQLFSTERHLQAWTSLVQRVAGAKFAP
jgi:glycosyltransferase involved in cell wall biosynthesis